MTIPKGYRTRPERISDYVRDAIPFIRNRLTPHEKNVAIHLRGNEVLFEGLKGIIEERIRGRAMVPVPSNPVECMAVMAMDRELRMVLNKLEFIYRSPALEPADLDGEQPE